MKTAKEFMITNLVALDPATLVLHGIQKLVQSNIKGAPVVAPSRNYRGIFTERRCLNVLTRLFDHRSSADVAGARSIRSDDLITRQLWMLQPEMDAFDAVSFLLPHRISGAPVVDGPGRFMRVFSESQGMRALIGAIYDNLPGAQVSSYMIPNSGRIINDDLGIDEVVKTFLRTTYRRFVVMRDGRVIGQLRRHNLLVNSQAWLRADISRNEASGPSWTASEFTDLDAMTIDESRSTFSTATIFRATAQRRLPVLRDKLLVGQITRKNLLNAANDILNRPAVKTL